MCKRSARKRVNRLDTLGHRAGAAVQHNGALQPVRSGRNVGGEGELNDRLNALYVDEYGRTPEQADAARPRISVLLRLLDDYGRSRVPQSMMRKGCRRTCIRFPSRVGRSRWITRMKDGPKVSRLELVDGSPRILTDGTLQLRGWSEEEWLADAMKPSRQRNLTPSQRQFLAHALKALRRMRSRPVQGGILWLDEQGNILETPPT